MGKLSQEVGLIVSASFFLLLIAAGIIALVLVYRRKQVEYLHEQARLKAAFEKELLEAQLEMQEQTMRHIAQEVHDNVNQTLGLAKLNLHTLKPASAGGVAEKILATKELVSKAIQDLRNLSKTLHADAVLSAGLGKAIETELSLIAKTAVFETRFSVRGEPLALDPQKELILFRTLQEALQNAVKHSEASLIEIELAYHNGVRLTVSDNGKGFDPRSLANHPEKGLGLRNMQNRTRLIGGEMNLHSEHGGTRIQITLPIIAA